MAYKQLPVLTARVWIESYTVLSVDGRREIPVLHANIKHSGAAIKRRRRYEKQLYYFTGFTPDMLPGPILLHRGKAVWSSSDNPAKCTSPAIYDRYKP